MTNDSALPAGTAAHTASSWAIPQPVPPFVDRLPETTALRAALAGLAAGLLGQWLFVDQLAGLNAPLWVAVLLAGAFLLRRPAASIDPADRWLPAAALIFAGFVALRDDHALIAFDVLAAIILTLLSLVAIGGHRITRGGWRAVVRSGSVAAMVSIGGGAYAAPAMRPLVTALRQSSDRGWLTIVRGVLLALPLLIVFAILFAAADAVFEVQLRAVFQLPDAAELLVRGVIAVTAGWLFVGAVCCAWLARSNERQDEPTAAVDGHRLGTVEALILLGLLDALFAAFVAIQAAYLFGGLDTLAASGMTYADYARRGFFELIGVALLAGALLLTVDRFVSVRSRAYIASAGSLIALTGVVLVSALYRLWLYQAAYGWTELRFYALVLIGWLAIGLVVMFVALLANRVRAIVRASVVAGLLIAVACNALGPQSFVTSQNLARAIDPALVAPGGETGLDLDYLRGLGADSLPALVVARDQLNDRDRTAVDDFLRMRAKELAEKTSSAGWPSFNFARWRAADNLRAAGY
jgi:hypothetical protein